MNCQWEAMPSMLYRRSSCTATVIGDSIYVLGGVGCVGTASLGERTTGLRTAERFDTITSSWEALPSMSEKRRSAGAAVLNGSLYVLGGMGPGMRGISSVECFRPDASNWTAVAPMRQGRFSLGVEALGGKLYAVGGCAARGDRLTSVECFDPTSGAWSDVASVKYPREGSKCVVANGMLLVLHPGTSNSIHKDTIEAFDPETNTWTELANAPPLMRSGVVASHYMPGQIYVVGGAETEPKYDTEANRSVLRVCPQTGECKEVSPMPSKRQWLACVAF